MIDRFELERWVGAVLVPEVRVPGTYEGHGGCTPDDAYLHRFPPAAVVAFGRRPGGPASPGELIEDLRARCVALGLEPPMVACDLEQGAGQHFPEGTLLPPALALAAAAKGHGDTGQGLNWIRSAGYVTGVEARELGVDLVLAPVADVNTNRDNPIIAVRSFGDEPAPVAARARAFLEGLQAGGAGGCAKHFPGHGDTAQDSHLELPLVEVDVGQLRETQLAPFRALIEADVDAVMVAHLDVPKLTLRPGTPTSLSRAAVRELLKRDLGFRGAVLSDAMNMGALESAGERYVRALEAGCDGLLCPHDNEQAAQEILRAVKRGDLSEERLYEAARAMTGLRERLAGRGRDLSATGLHRGLRETRVTRAIPAGSAGLGGPGARADFAATVADRALCASGDAAAWTAARSWPVRVAFPEDLPAGGAEALEQSWNGSKAAPGGDGLLFLVPEEVSAGSGRQGLDRERREQLDARIQGAWSEGLRVGLLWFASPQTLPAAWWQCTDLQVLVAFAPTQPMLLAARRFLRGEAPATGSLPIQPG